MKHIIVAGIIGLISSTALAVQEVVLDSKIKTDEYISSVGGPVGCKMPENLSQPKSGDCEVRKTRFETGWKRIKVGDTCYDETINLIELEKMKTGILFVEVPQTETYRIVVDCPV